MTAGEPGFEIARRGYRTSQVDVWAEEVRHRIEALEAERDEARRLAGSLQGSLDEMRAREAAPDTFGARADRILRMAEHDAHLRRERAEAESAQIRELAHAEAERTVAQARAEAARVRTDAERVRDEAERTAARARAELADARRDADLRVDTAASMNEHVQSLRSAVRGEIARLHAALGAELRVLDAPAVAAPDPAADPVPAAEDAEPPTTEMPEQDTPAVVVSLPVQRDSPAGETTTPATGTPAP